MSDDFEIVPSSRDEVDIEDYKSIVLPSKQDKEKIVTAVANNFERVLGLASEILEINRIEVQTDAIVKILEEKRKMLNTEADVYVKKVNADTNAVVSKVEMIRILMQDYYKYGQDKICGEEFSKIITEVIHQMGDASNV